MRFDPKLFGARLKLAREERGLGLREAATLAGVSPSWLSRTEKAERPEVALGHVVALCAALKLHLEWATFGVGPMWTSSPPQEQAG